MKKRILALTLAGLFIVLSSCKVVDETEPISFGTVSEGNVYTNEFIGVTADFTDDWTFLAEEEIAEQNNLVADALPEDIAETLENATIVYDMQANNTVSGASVNINLENLSLAQTLALDEEKYISSQLDSVKETLNGMGFENVETEETKVSFAGKECNALKVTASFSGISFYEYVVVTKVGNYMANITVAGIDEAELSEIIALFKEI